MSSETDVDEIKEFKSQVELFNDCRFEGTQRRYKNIRNQFTDKNNYNFSVLEGNTMTNRVKNVL